MPHPKANMRPQAINTDRGTRGMPSGISPDKATALPVVINASALLLSDGTIIAPKINGLTNIVFHVTLDTFAVLSSILTSKPIYYSVPIICLAKINPMTQTIAVKVRFSLLMARVQEKSWGDGSG